MLEKEGSQDTLNRTQKMLLDYICEYFGLAHHHVVLKWLKEGMPLHPMQLASVLDSISVNHFLELVDRIASNKLSAL